MSRRAPYKPDPASTPEERLAWIRETADVLYGEPERAPAEPRSLRRTGKGTWRIQFGESDVDIRHSVGLWRYARLLANPRQEIRAMELALLGATEELVQAPREKVDPKTAAALKEALSEIQELEEERDGLLALGREDEADRVDEDVELKKKSLNLVAYDGRERDDSTPTEKARKAVTNSLAYARERLMEEVPGLSEYLLANVRPASAAWIFLPPDGEEWLVDLGDF